MSNAFPGLRECCQVNIAQQLTLYEYIGTYPNSISIHMDDQKSKINRMDPKTKQKVQEKFSKNERYNFI